ncbi:MAG: MarC family protein [Candidatus Micrarchaeota archaeon]
MFDEFIASFALLFIIMNPLSSIPVYLSLAEKLTVKQKGFALYEASLVAGGLAIAFLFFGPEFLKLLGLTNSSFKIAGGIVLGILGLQTVLNIKFSSKPQEKDPKTLGLIIGTPMLTGPGVLTSVLLSSRDSGYVVTFFAIIAVVAASWLVLSYANKLEKWLGHRFISVFSRVMGLFLVARGVQLLVLGVVELI